MATVDGILGGSLVMTQSPLATRVRSTDEGIFHMMFIFFL